MILRLGQSPPFQKVGRSNSRVTRHLFQSTALLCFLLTVSLSAAPISFIEDYCFDCHDGDSSKGGLDLEALSVASWDDGQNFEHWERVLKRIKNKEMPPAKSKHQPGQGERDMAISALHERLMKNAVAASGSSVIRRLSRAEYKYSVESLLGIEFKIPDEFPEDTVVHGFDNSAAGLLLSPALMEAYFDAATLAADTLFPHDGQPVEVSRFTVGPEDFTFAETGARVTGDAIRMVARTARTGDSCIWPAKFETRIPGKYKLRITASRFAPGSVAIPSFDGPMKLRIYGFPVDADEGKTIGTLRKIHEFEVSSNEPETLECELELRRTEAPVLYFANAMISRPTDRPPPDYQASPTLEQLIRQMLTRDKRLFAVWKDQEIGGGVQRGSAWANLKDLRDAPDLDLDSIDHSKEEIEKVVQKLVKGIGFVDPVFTYQLFDEGPALQIHSMEIIGPLDVRVSEEETKRREKLVPRFLAAGSTEARPEAKVRPIMKWFLGRAFRRPATRRELREFTTIVRDHMKAGHSLEEGLHLGIRAVLISPQFLYRGHGEGRLNEFDLAARLSYFLTSAPPDDPLLAVAGEKELSDPARLAAEARRLIGSEAADRFFEHFTRQWLELEGVDDIVPNARLINFQASHRRGMLGEAEGAFAEILRRNLPLQTFIKPDFMHTTERVANEIYGLNMKINGWRMGRIDLPEDFRFGGLLTQAGVMMATSNGTQTQPVERGVWVLRNILGDPPGKPPPGTPALPPDTRGTKTIREQMAAHAADTKCASCHRKIDPIGFVLENFDAYGRWRTHYPKWTQDDDGKEVRADGSLIDPIGKLPGGVELSDFEDLRNYVLSNMEMFGVCLSEKLMTYAMGRRPNYAERFEIKRIVEQNLNDSKEGEAGGFQDLLIALIQSDAFRTK